MIPSFFKYTMQRTMSFKIVCNSRIVNFRFLRTTALYKSLPSASDTMYKCPFSTHVYVKAVDKLQKVVVRESAILVQMVEEVDLLYRLVEEIFVVFDAFDAHKAVLGDVVALLSLRGKDAKKCSP